MDRNLPHPRPRCTSATSEWRPTGGQDRGRGNRSPSAKGDEILRLTPVIGVAALAVGFYHLSGGAGFEPPLAAAAGPIRSAVPAAVTPAAEAASTPAATSDRIAAVRAVAAPRGTIERALDETPVIRVRRGNEVESVRIRRLVAPARAPMSTPDADAAFERIFDAAARGIVLPDVAAAPARNEPVEFTITEVAAPGAIDAAVGDALAGALDLRMVIGEAVNMRGGPGIQHPVVGTLGRGTRAEVLREESGWAELRLASGETGWMAANFLR